MRWFGRILAAAALFLLTGVLAFVFLSKERLCNAALDRLAREEVALCFQERDTGPLHCDMKRITLSFAHSPVARIGAIRISPQKVEAERIRLTGMAATTLPPRIAKVIFEPLSGRIDAQGDFGTLEGTVSWRTRHIRLILTPSPLMRRDYRSTLRQFKRKNGKYLYETAF